MKFGYARVGTAKQDLTRQIATLENDGCDEVYCDIQSGKNMKRAELQKILSKIRENDTFVVTDIDRLGRNFTEVTELYTKLKDMKVNIAGSGRGGGWRGVCVRKFLQVYADKQILIL